MKTNITRPLSTVALVAAGLGLVSCSAFDVRNSNKLFSDTARTRGPHYHSTSLARSFDSPVTPTQTIEDDGPMLYLGFVNLVRAPFVLAVGGPMAIGAMASERASDYAE